MAEQGQTERRFWTARSVPGGRAVHAVDKTWPIRTLCGQAIGIPKDAEENLTPQMRLHYNPRVLHTSLLDRRVFDPAVAGTCQRCVKARQRILDGRPQ